MRTRRRGRLTWWWRSLNSDFEVEELRNSQRELKKPTGEKKKMIELKDKYSKLKVEHDTLLHDNINTMALYTEQKDLNSKVEGSILDMYFKTWRN